MGMGTYIRVYPECHIRNFALRPGDFINHLKLRDAFDIETLYVVVYAKRYFPIAFAYTGKDYPVMRETTTQAAFNSPPLTQSAPSP